MLSSSQILKLLDELNEYLKTKGESGEIGIIGGAVMCLVYKARKATKDIDAVFAPTKVIRQAVAQIALDHKLSPDWLNDAAKGYLTGNFKRENFLSLSHLTVWAPEARYMLAMKCLSARWDSSDRDDVIFLLKHLKIKNAKVVFSLIESYYPKSRIPPKTQFMIEEVLEKV